MSSSAKRVSQPEKHWNQAFNPIAPDILNHGLCGWRQHACEDWGWECEVQHFFDGPDVMNLKILQEFRLDIFLYVFLILLRKNQLMNSGAPGGQHLFFDSP